jgi:outer membrane lipoprotein-sorting protein
MFNGFTSRGSTATAVIAGLLSLTTICPTAAVAATNAPTAATIIEKADRIRFPDRDFEVEVTITTTGQANNPEPHSYKILSKGTEKTIVMTTEPPTERGQILLLRGNDLWAFMPNVSQPIRLSLAQRLTGQVANGDLARANFAGDYSATIIRSETIKKQPYFVLELKANNASVPYHRVVYWVHKKDYRPHKAEFYTLSGRLRKTAYYSDFQRMEGEIRPTRLVMEDALHRGIKSVLEYKNMRLKKLPDKYFTKDYLKKLQ